MRHREPFCDMVVGGITESSGSKTHHDRTQTRRASTSIAPRWTTSRDDLLELHVNVDHVSYVDIRLCQSRKGTVSVLARVWQRPAGCCSYAVRLAWDNVLCHHHRHGERRSHGCTSSRYFETMDTRSDRGCPSWLWMALPADTWWGAYRYAPVLRPSLGCPTVCFESYATANSASRTSSMSI